MSIKVPESFFNGLKEPEINDICNYLMHDSIYDVIKSSYCYGYKEGVKNTIQSILKDVKSFPNTTLQAYFETFEDKT